MRNILFAILVLAVVTFIWYGIKTDCPDTAGYVPCKYSQSK